MQYHAFDLDTRSKITPRLLLALSLAVNKMNMQITGNTSKQDVIVGSNLMVDTRQHISELQNKGLLNCVAQMNVGQIVSENVTVSEAFDSIQHEIKERLNRFEYLAQYQQDVEVGFCPEGSTTHVCVELSNVGKFQSHQQLADVDCLCTANMDCESLSLIVSGYQQRVHCRLYYSQTFISLENAARVVRNI